MPPAPRLAVRTVLLLFVAANCAILLALDAYPFVDLPFHLAAATIYRFYGTPGTAFAKYFVIEPLFPEPNIAHLVLAALPVFPSVDLANRVLLAIYMVATPFLMLRLIRRLDGNPWYSLLSLLLVYNFNVAWGFAGFVLAIPLTLAFLLALISFVEQSRASTAAWMGALIVLLFFTHVLAMLFAVAVMVVVTLFVSGRSLGRTRLVLCAAAPGGLLLAWWWLGRNDPPTLAFLVDYYRSEYLTTWWSARRRILTHDNAQLFAGRAGALVALTFTMAILGPLAIQIWRLRTRARARVVETRMQTVLAFGAVALLCAIVLPDRLPGQSALYERFSVFFLFACVLAGSVLAPQPWQKTHTAAVCVVAAIYLALRVDYFRAFAAETRPFAADSLPEGGDRTLHGLMYEARFRGLPAYIHFPDYFIVWRHGIASTELTQFRFSAIHRRADGPVLPFYDTSPNSVTPTPDTVDYLLIRSQAPPRVPEGFVLEREGGKWRLYGKE